MKKKNMFIIAFSLIVLFGALAVSDRNDSIKNNLPNGENGSSAVWISHYYDDTEMIKEADLIIIGKVMDSYTEQRSDMIFTRQIVEIQNTIKANDLAQADLESTPVVAKQRESSLPEIHILQTGGKLNGMYTEPFNEAPLLEKGKKYVFLLMQTPDEQYLPSYYGLMGGYQGVGEIVNDKIVFGKETKDVFKLLNNRSVEQIIPIVDNVIKKYGDTSYDKKCVFQLERDDKDTEMP